MPSRIVVLLSGAGSLTRSLLQAAKDGELAAEIVAVGSDRVDAGGLAHARDYGIETFVVDPGEFPDRAAWDSALADRLEMFIPDWIVSAGFMRLFGAQVLGRFPMRIVNSHPSLLPAFPGAHAVDDALAAGVTTTGCTVHLVDEGVDTGPVLAQRPVQVEADDTAAELHDRIKVQERELLVEVVQKLCTGNARIEGGKAVLL